MFGKKEKTKLKKWHLIAFGIIIIVFVVLKIYFWIAEPVALKKVEIGGQIISVMVADTPALRYKGLSGTDLTASKQGMLFIFPTSDYYTFVMRDMDYPIDIIWIKDGEIVEIAPNLAPEKGVLENQLTRYPPRLPATHVLEVPAGFVAEHNIKIGDTVKW